MVYPSFTDWFCITDSIVQHFRQLYNAADILIVGRFGTRFLGGSRSYDSHFDLIIGFALELEMGWELLSLVFTVLVILLRLKAVAATWILGAILSGLVMLMGFFGLYPLLQYLETPAEILPQSYEYISMIVSCVGVSFCF